MCIAFRGFGFGLTRFRSRGFASRLLLRFALWASGYRTERGSGRRSGAEFSFRLVWRALHNSWRGGGGGVPYGVCCFRRLGFTGP